MMMRVDLIGWALLMIALAMGFSVLHRAAKDADKRLKLLGNIIGMIILVGCLILAVSEVTLRARMMKRGAMPASKRFGETKRYTPSSKINIPQVTQPPVFNKPETPAEKTPSKE